MTDFHEKIQRLEAHREKVDARIAEYEAMAKKAKGPVSPIFAERLDELRAEHERLDERLRELRLEDATTWSTDDPRIGVLRVCDEIAGRINELFTFLERNRP
jgi:predicted nuclease with TOPRIM domain